MPLTVLATQAAPSRAAIPRGSTPDLTVAVTSPEVVSMLETDAPRLLATQSVTPASASPSGPLRSGSATVRRTAPETGSSSSTSAVS